MWCCCSWWPCGVENLSPAQNRAQSETQRTRGGSLDESVQETGLLDATGSASGCCRRRGPVTTLGAGARRTVGNIPSLVHVLDYLAPRNGHAIAASQAVPAAGVAAAHGGVDALLAPPAPGFLEIEGLELLLVLFCNWPPILGWWHALSRFEISMVVVFRFFGVLLG